MTEIGARVWAVRNDTDEAVYAYGFGTYVGDHLMPGWDHPSTLAVCEKSIRKHDAGPPLIDAHAYYGRKVDAGEMTREQADAEIARVEANIAAEKARPIAERALDLAKRCGLNPKIELDSGA